MKRFFLVFSILMIVFLVLTAGCMAAVYYGAVKTYDREAAFIGDWAVTAVPYTGSRLVYAKGDLFILKKVPARDVRPDQVILFIVADRSGFMSGLVDGRDGGALKVEGADGRVVSVPDGDVVAVYYKGITGFVDLLYKLRSPVTIAVFALVLAASILMWIRLPSRRPGGDSLSQSDGDISSNLY